MVVRAEPPEFRPWSDVAIRLLQGVVEVEDDQYAYDRDCCRCLAAAESWRPEKLALAFEAFFTRLLA
jgi:hypothetical protein